MIQRIMNAINKKNITLEQTIKLAVSIVPGDTIATAVMDKQTESSMDVAK
ncbi:hypothetical protein [Priestia filamentosa]|nr:hypothetical protein [Priestia filamentosa]